MKRLLLDQGVPRSTARILNAEGWDAVHVGDIGMSKARDRAILDFAERDGRVCVTLDADFHAILAVANAQKPSVIRIRREGLDGRKLADLLKAAWSKIEAEVVRGALITITESAVRVRRLPIWEGEQ